MAADFDSANDRDTLLRAKRKWMKALDNDKVPNAARLYGLLDTLFNEAKARIIKTSGIEAFQRAPKSQEQQTNDARADRILRVRDSSGRARARKF